MKKIYCTKCEKRLSKDELAICKKMLGRQILHFFCITCLAEYLDCTKNDLLIKIEEFKEQGCSLF